MVSGTIVSTSQILLSVWLRSLFMANQAYSRDVYISPRVGGVREILSGLQSLVNVASDADALEKLFNKALGALYVSTIYWYGKLEDEDVL